MPKVSACSGVSGRLWAEPAENKRSAAVQVSGHPLEKHIWLLRCVGRQVRSLLCDLQQESFHLHHSSGLHALCMSSVFVFTEDAV